MEQENKNDGIRYLTMLVEKMGDDIKLLAEGQSDINRKLDEMNGRMDRMEIRMDRIEARIDKIESDISALKSDVSGLKSDVSDLKSGQTQILDYLFRIEEEIQSIRKDMEENYEKKGHDASWQKEIDVRVSELENSLKINNLQGAGIANDKKKSE